MGFNIGVAAGIVMIALASAAAPYNPHLAALSALLASLIALSPLRSSALRIAPLLPSIIAGTYYSWLLSNVMAGLVGLPRSPLLAITLMLHAATMIPLVRLASEIHVAGFSRWRVAVASLLSAALIAVAAAMMTLSPPASAAVAASAYSLSAAAARLLGEGRLRIRVLELFSRRKGVYTAHLASRERRRI